VTTVGGETTATASSAAPGSGATDSTPAPGTAETVPGAGQTPSTGGAPVSTAAPTPTSGTIQPTQSTANVGTNPTASANSPIVTSPAPPDTIGGTDTDFLLGPRSVAGVQFGASMPTVLSRLTSLLGAPLTVQESFADCANGTATAVQWYALGVIVTDRGFQYYTVGMATDMYEGLPVPGWHTGAGVVVGATTEQVQAAYPNQVTMGEVSGGFASFDITAGADAGMSGQLFNGTLQSLAAGSSEC
jgi:hypothetical protein